MHLRQVAHDNVARMPNFTNAERYAFSPARNPSPNPNYNPNPNPKISVLTTTQLFLGTLPTTGSQANYPASLTAVKLAGQCFDNETAAMINYPISASQVICPRQEVRQIDYMPLPLSAQHGAALPHRPAPTGEQRWLPAASTLVVVG